LFRIEVPPQKYDTDARRTVLEQIDQRVAAIPGVASSSLSGSVLIGGGRSRTSVEIIGRTPDPSVSTYINVVGHRFFETMGLPIVRGRSFNAYDRLTSPRVAIVNQRFVRDYLPEGDPIGRRFKRREATDEVTYEIVGVCGDTPYDRTRAPVPPTWFGVFAQAADPRAATFEVRSAASLSAILPLIRDAVSSVDKDLPVSDVRTQVQQMDATLSQERLFVTLSAAFGVLALLLASVGIYGILAQNVSRRTSEIGLRVALGATRAHVLAMVLREASVLAVVGVIVGFAAAMGLGRHVESVLFGITPNDPLAITGAIVAMLVVALAAGWIPARRACRLDPMVALRHE
jgi:predicted permease